MTQYKTKVDIVYEALMDSISKGAYRTGDRLVISQIAKDNHMSDIPVREAIRRLESEGYVQINANQGAVICNFTKERLFEIFQIKAVLEGYAARLCIDYLSPRDIRKLRSCNEQLRRALDEGNDKKFSQLNIQFHLGLYERSPQRELYGMIQELWRKYSVTKSVFSVAPSRMSTSVQEHEEILRLIEAKSYDGVEEAMRQHKFKAGYDLIARIEKLEPAPAGS